MGRNVHVRALARQQCTVQLCANEQERRRKVQTNPPDEGRGQSQPQGFPTLDGGRRESQPSARTQGDAWERASP